MKYFLQALWDLVQQIPGKFTKILHTPSSRSTASSSASTQDKLRILPVLKRKRKTFRSFLKEQSPSRTVRRKSAGQSCKPKRMSRYSKLHKRKLLVTFQQESFQDDHIKDANTNEIQLECSAIFEDNNGFQISVIAPQRYQQSLSRINESDQELLKLFCENQMQAKKSQKKIIHISRQAFRQKGWWQIEIESVKNNFCKIIEAAPKQEVIKNIKVITLIDLTEEEDNPKVFHIPLSLHY